MINELNFSFSEVAEKSWNFGKSCWHCRKRTRWVGVGRDKGGQSAGRRDDARPADEQAKMRPTERFGDAKPKSS